MAQQLSWGPVTFAHKYIVPWALTVITAVCVYTMALAPALSLPGAVDIAPLLRIIFCFGAAVITWASISQGGGLVSVDLDNRNLFLSDLRRQATVPLTSVTKVTEGNYLPHHPVTLEFDRDTVFGRRVTFFPDMTDQWIRFSPHPVVAQLERAVQQARGGAAA